MQGFALGGPHVAKRIQQTFEIRDERGGQFRIDLSRGLPLQHHAPLSQHVGGGRLPDGNWIGMESMPNSLAKVRTLATYCEKPISSTFSDRPLAEIAAKAAQAGGQTFAGSSASLALQFQVLPMIPQQILFWEEEPEDGFEAKTKVLYDHHALDFPDLRSDGKGDV